MVSGRHPVHMQVTNLLPSLEYENFLRMYDLESVMSKDNNNLNGMILTVFYYFCFLISSFHIHSFFDTFPSVSIFPFRITSFLLALSTDPLLACQDSWWWRKNIPSFFVSFHLSFIISCALFLHTHTHTYIYIYIITPLL